MRNRATNGSGRSRERALLYRALAEALDDPPEWLTSPGHQWPLFAGARKLAASSDAAMRAVAALENVAAESLAGRRARYRTLFLRGAKPDLELHENLRRNGQLLGPKTQELERLYRAAGLRIAGRELPDHASVELAFLAYLAQKAASEPTQRRQWRALEKGFLRRHAGRWLPELGWSIAATGDPVYAPVGALLAGWLEESLQRPVTKRAPKHLPTIAQRQCTLCGFCVQVCPAGALIIDENDTETTLVLAAARCYDCGKCVRACETAAMRMGPRHEDLAATTDGKLQILRRSPRAKCPACGEPTVSRAELDYVARQLGRPRWLEYCLRCRAY